MWFKLAKPPTGAEMLLTLLFDGGEALAYGRAFLKANSEGYEANIATGTDALVVSSLSWFLGVLDAVVRTDASAGYHSLCTLFVCL